MGTAPWTVGVDQAQLPAVPLALRHCTSDFGTLLLRTVYTVAAEASAVVHVRARAAHLEETLGACATGPGITRTQTQVVLSTLFERPFPA
jgi:hypothetical protein